MDLLTVSLSGVAGLVIGILAMVAYSKAGLNKDQQKAEQLLKKAETEAEAKVKQAVLDGKTQAHDLRVEAEKEIKERKGEKRNDAESDIAIFICRNDYRPEQRRQEPPEDSPVSEENVCCDAPA